MNTSILESAISEQLFCNDKVTPNNEPCYGISTVSGLQRAAQQGQKIYQINSKNKAQLANIAMSGTEMADDINKAIASGGYVIVPEKPVDGTGRNAIYVYMTYNGQDSSQTWKISGGLNGGILAGLLSLLLLVISFTSIVVAPILLTISAIVLLGYSIISFIESLDGCDKGIGLWLGVAAIIGSWGVIRVIKNLTRAIAGAFVLSKLSGQAVSGFSSAVNSACKVTYP